MLTCLLLHRSKKKTNEENYEKKCYHILHERYPWCIRFFFITFSSVNIIQVVIALTTVGKLDRAYLTFDEMLSPVTDTFFQPTTFTKLFFSSILNFLLNLTIAVQFIWAFSLKKYCNFLHYLLTQHSPMNQFHMKSN